MKSWSVVVAMYGLFTIIGAMWIDNRSEPQAHWIAAKDLERNRSLQKDDLRWTQDEILFGVTPPSSKEWEGKYLTKAAREGDSVTMSDLRLHPETQSWIAAKELKPNHRLVKQDLLLSDGSTPALRNDDWEGKYVKSIKEKGKAVSSADLALDPVIEPRETEVLGWFKLNDFPASTRGLNAGDAIDLCSNRGTCFSGRVSAISCEQKQCFAGVWIQQCEFSKYLKYLKNNETFSMILLSASGESKEKKAKGIR